MALQESAASTAQVERGLPVAARRALFAALVAGTTAALLALMVRVLAPGGIGALDLLLIGLFGMTLPWSVIGFWNATIGFLIMRFAADPVAAVFPAVARLRADAPITAATAILMCLRNENPARIARNMRPLLAGLAAAGAGDRFHLYLLSDTSDAVVAAEEAEQFSALADEWRERIAVTWRRRRHNDGFKAGNIADFCAQYGERHELAVVLDADSLMPAAAVLRMVRLMQAEPRLGILQGLVIARPASSAFARLFQFSMRLGMRSYTIGSAWWQAECGPYWGHNAVLRLQPFTMHCRLPVLPGDGPLSGSVLSHDQIEAVLMARAKYEVRVLPEETLGFEENPPGLLEFIRRDLRWCQGNMQYGRFLRLPGLRPLGRYQLAAAMLMFLGSPACVLFTLVAALAVASSDRVLIDPGAGLMLLALLLPMGFAPQLATVLDVLTRPRAADAFGGRIPFLAGALAAMSFMQLLIPIMWLSHTIFLGGLACGRAIGWGTQAREDRAVPVAAAVRALWPQTLFGCAVLGVLALTHPGAVPYAAIVALGPALAVPLAVLTASERCGRLLRRLGLARLPEEIDPPAILRAEHSDQPSPEPARRSGSALAAGESAEPLPSTVASCSAASNP